MKFLMKVRLDLIKYCFNCKLIQIYWRDILLYTSEKAKNNEADVSGIIFVFYFGSAKPPSLPRNCFNCVSEIGDIYHS